MFAFKKSGALAAAAVAAVMTASGAQALSVNVSGPTTNYTEAKGFETAFLGQFNPAKVTTEDFEGAEFTAGAEATSFSTKVGTFTQIISSPNTGNGGLLILDSGTTPFSGRRDMTNADNSGKWLDSNDSREVKWELDLAKASKAVGFFITDPSDVNATLTASFLNGEKKDFTLTAPKVSNGGMIYVEAIFHNPITEIVFAVNSNNDGWGIDDISAVAVPLPAGAWLALTGAGVLAGIGRKRRKVQAPA
jgi:hypothetical protein